MQALDQLNCPLDLGFIHPDALNFTMDITKRECEEECSCHPLAKTLIQINLKMEKCSPGSVGK